MQWPVIGSSSGYSTGARAHAGGSDKLNSEKLHQTQKSSQQAARPHNRYLWQERPRCRVPELRLKTLGV